MQNPFLIGTKIYLRPVEREDARVLVPWFNHPDVTRTLQVYRPMNLRGEEEFLDKIAQDEHHLALGIAVLPTDKLIGVAGFHQIDFKNRHACFGITIGEPSGTVRVQSPCGRR